MRSASARKARAIPRALLCLLAGAACDGGPPPARMPPVAVERLAALDGQRIRAAEREPGDWPSHGLGYAERRYSPLKEIHAGNVGRLGLAWHYDFGSDGIYEATPIVVGGVLFVTAPWGVVHAIDGRSGSRIWRHDPAAGPGRRQLSLCCGPVNRGVAAWKGRIYLGTLDGRLVALDARTGEVAWEVQTTDPEQPYSITGAPRVVRGKVIIGNGGADFGARGYVTAYDAETGSLVWRFRTTPDPSWTASANPALRAAAATWGPGSPNPQGGGGTVWDALSYDAESGLLYVGVGNGAPLNRYRRDPSGGDNLFLASIVALDVDSGEYRWHYQTTPYEGFDYTATQQMILADLEIGGRTRRVLMQAPKNGFFYVLDRLSGELLSADPFAAVRWATGVDPATGRPIESAQADYRDAPRLVQPSTSGAHSWHAMAYSPDTGLVYLPVREDYDVLVNGDFWRYRPDEGPKAARRLAHLAGDAELPERSSRLSAWDPVARRERWRVEHTWLENGGALATGGNLVFQGTSSGTFAAYRADTGEALWKTAVQTGVVAAPVSYELDGRQYVAVVAGYGGALTGVDGRPERVRSEQAVARLLVFALDGSAELPALRTPGPPPEPPLSEASEETIALGARLYGRHCSTCHGAEAVNFSPLPDLRYMTPRTHREFADIVLQGARAEHAMPSFADRLDEAGVEAIRAYLIRRAHETR